MGLGNRLERVNVNSVGICSYLRMDMLVDYGYWTSSLEREREREFVNKTSLITRTSRMQ